MSKTKEIEELKKTILNLEATKDASQINEHDLSIEVQELKKQNEIYRVALGRIENFYTPIEDVKEMARQALQDAQKLAGGK